MKKIIAVFMALIFTYSVISPDLYAAIAQIPAVNYPKITSIGEPVVSYSNGRINAGAIFGDLSARKKIIINIQDLHCNPEVQRKIAAILGELDSKYGFSNLYCEGAYSDIDTGWINDIDADKRDAVLETLLNAGRLTGSEYYSIVSNKNKIIKGIENAQIHSGNMIRFGNILQKQQYYKRQIEQLDKELLLLQNKHFSFENKRFDKLLTSYKTGRISSNKYYSGLIKYIDKVNRKENKENSLYYIDLSAYPNIAKYIAINNTAKLLNLKKITSQLVRFIDELKAKLPYGVFAELSAKTQNFSNLTDFYAYMPALMRDYSIELDPSQTDLKLFFDHALKETELNFLDLVQEEKRVIEKIRLALSKSKSELEVSFASDFYSYFKDYLLASITADDHKYFAAQFDEFRNVWEKYTYESVLNNLNADFEEINEFYRSNFRRDEIFSEKIAQSPAGRDDIQKTGIASLKSAQLSDILKNSDISVIITGGFHSEGIKEILETKNISYLTITPNVSKISDSNSVYADLAKQQAKYFTKNSKIEANAIALAMGSADAKIEFKNNTAFVELNGEKLILPWDNNSKSFKFEETIVELSESGRPASVFTKTAIENIKTHVNSIRSLLSPTGNSEILLSIIENLAAAAVNSGYFNGYGLIWEIAKNPELQKTISAESGINLNILASFPDILQKLAAQKVSIKEAKKQFADSPLISAILNTPEFEKFASALATFSKAAAADIDSQELPSAILPKNQAKVRDMLQNGEKPLKIAWYVARTEFFESLNPFKFIKEHETKGAKTGAAIVSAVTYLPLLVFGIALAFAPFMLPLAMGLLAGSAALGVSLNLSVHIIIDRPYIANNDIGQYKIFEGKPIHEIITAVNGDATNLKALEKNRTQIKNYVERQFIGEEKGVTELISNALDAGREARVRIGTGQISIENEADDGISIQTVFESLINTANSTKKDKKAQIGRFGLGFFSSLNYLWEETDTLEIVSVRNNDSFKVVVGAKYDQAGEREFYIVSVNFISKEEALAMSSGLKSNGTAVNIKTGYLNRQDDLDKISGSVKENFSHSMKPVHLLTGDTSEVLSAGSTNYAQIDKNPNDELKILVKKSAENDNTLLRSDRPGNGKLVVTIKGVKFFELPVLGGNSFKEIIIKLPNDLNFSVSRDSITTDTILIDHVKKLIEETINSGMSLSDKMAVLNALYALCEKFEKQRKDFIKEAGIKEKAIELIESEIKKANEENRNLIVVTDEVETYEFFGNDNGGIAVLANPYLLDEYLYETDNITMPVDSSSPNQQTIIFFSINNDTVYLKPYSKKAFIGMYYYLKYYNVIHDRILLNGINGDWLKDDKIAGMLRGAAKEVNSLNFRIASNRDTNFYIENHISDMSLADAEKDKTLENYSAVKAYDLRKGKNIDSGSLIDFVQKKTGMKNKGQISVELRQVIYDLNQVEGVFAGELLKNAKKSGADEIDVSVNDKRAIVTIEDNGAGMDLNEIEDMLLFNLK
ncbi:MAG: ATP-binding protein, partial [Endomicrobium sp.]|nr:ATP-binding protein [Endomicrobium sp.]